MDKKIIVAGASGYLGHYLVKVFKEAGYHVIALARSEKKLEGLKAYIDEVKILDISNPEALRGIMLDADYVISTVGITRQKDGLTYMDVDYQCNLNLLNEALKSKVDKFMYISALNGEHLTELKIMAAKEAFVQALTEADLKSYVIRPSGFFSDVGEIFEMAQKGRVYLFGSGMYQSNPIHGEDLARFCLDKIMDQPGDYSVGGPQVLTQIDIANEAFNLLGKAPRISRIPEAFALIIKYVLRRVTKVSFYGPIEFFLTVLTMDMVGPTYGNHTIGTYFHTLS